MASFEMDFNRIMNDVENRMRESVTRSVYELATTLIQRTPVDTGQLVGSWVVSLNGASPGFQGTPDTTGNNSLNRIRAGLEAYELGDVVYILNSTPYAPFVEFGTSKMSPRSFVRSTVADAPQIVNATVREFTLRI